MCHVGEDDRAWPRAEAREAHAGPTCPGDLREGAFRSACFKVWADAWEEAANHSGEKVLRTRSGGRGPAHSLVGPWGLERRIWQKRAFCDRGCCLSRRHRGNSQRPEPGRQSKALGKWSRSRRPSASRGTLRRDHPEVMTSGWPGGGPGSEAPRPPLALECPPAVPSHSGSRFQGRSFERVGCHWDPLDGVGDWTPLKPFYKLEILASRGGDLLARMSK